MEAIFKDLIVIELASVLAGPSVGMFFAELGARVIKIENPRFGGDVTRSWKLAHEDKADTRSAYFSCINWGKESLSLDLKQEPDRVILHQLLAKADIMLSSFIPGQAERLGIEAESLMKAYPKLILGEINGYGKDNARPAYDAIIQAEAGFMYINGEGEQLYKMPVALMDVLAAHQLKEGLLLA
ncbi:MAG: CoA transferase, partial [Bacteroidia bacterium]